jgi:hypothetical protein
MNFDEDPITDSSGNSNTGALKASGEPNFSSSTGCAFDGCYVFDGFDDYIGVSDSATLDIAGDNIAIVAQVTPDFIQTDPASYWIVDKSNGNNSGYRFLFQAGVDDWRFRIFTSAAVNCDTTGVTWTADTLHHFAASYDGTNHTVYWDGDLEDTCADTGDVTTNNTNLSIGVEDDLTTANWGGGLDDVAVFARTLDSTDINDIMTNGLAQTAVATGTSIKFYN